MNALDPAHFRAPVTHETLREDGAFWVAESGAKFPVVSSIPILFPDARLALAELKQRAHALLAYYESNVEQLKLELKNESLSTLTHDRLKRTRSVQIHHLEFLRDLFAPLKLASRPQVPAPDFGYRLPPSQALQGYFPNLVRDWSSSSRKENEAHFSLVCDSAMGAPLGRLLVAGAGGGRLAYDVHERLQPTETICADLNLVLTLASQRIVRGETLKVAEFPVAPRNIAAASGVVRECRAPHPVREGFSHVFADVYYLPFADGSFDSVLTPWLVDILPHRLDFVVSEINRVLKPGGRWINSGSFNFRFASWSDCLSIEEGIEAIQSNGFTSRLMRQDMVPYLRSDLDAHERSEFVTTFVMEKTGQARAPHPAPMRPAWMLDSSAPVPVPPSGAQQFATLESQAFVISLVDGKRTGLQIAEAVALRYGLQPQDALEAVVSFLMRLEDDSVFRASVLA
jgi:SAM-dependent methyltransferase